MQERAGVDIGGRVTDRDGVRDAKEAIVREYLRCVNAKALSGIEEIFTRDATLEDPAGSEPVVGREEIARFYSDISFRNVQSIELTGTVRVTTTHAAFPASVTLKAGGGSSTIDVIEVFEFDADNRVVNMRTYWG